MLKSFFRKLLGKPEVTSSAPMTVSHPPSTEAPEESHPSESPSLFQQFLAEAKGVPPSRLTDIAAMREIASSTVEAQMGVIEECLVTFLDGSQNVQDRLGKYGSIALSNLLVPLLRDHDLPFAADYTPRLAKGTCVLGASAVTHALNRHVERHGWTDELREVVLETDALASLHQAAFDPFPRANREAWVTLLRSDVDEMETSLREKWIKVFTFIAKNPPDWIPNVGWTNEAARLRMGLGEHWDVALRWLSAVRAPSTMVRSTRPSGLSAAHDANAKLLHGLVAVYKTETRPLSAEARQALTSLAQASFAHVDGLGCYLPKLGYRCLELVKDDPEAMSQLVDIVPRRLPAPKAPTTTSTSLPSRMVPN